MKKVILKVKNDFLFTFGLPSEGVFFCILSKQFIKQVNSFINCGI